MCGGHHNRELSCRVKVDSSNRNSVNKRGCPRLRQPLLFLNVFDVLVPLLWLGNKIFFDPFFPSPLQGMNILISQSDKFPRHTGAGSFIWSGAVESYLLILGIISCPRTYIVGVNPHCSDYFPVTLSPILFGSHIQKDKIRAAKYVF